MTKLYAMCTGSVKSLVRAIFVLVLAAGILKAVTFERQVKMMEGAYGDDFGASISAKGDINGDGYNDIIVGAYYNDFNGISNAGAVYIYYGGPSMDTIPDVIMGGDTVYDRFGCSVSNAGDVNGDGYDDVIVGAYGHDYNTGAAYIYYGGPSMDTIPDVIMTGEAVSDLFGLSVSTAGDVNGDGYDDVIVGAIYNDFNGNNSAGAAYIYYGGSSMDSIPDVIMGGEAVGDEFGYSVSTAGDVNGDGYDDVIVGAPWNDFGGQPTAGAAYIFYGGSSMDSIPDVIMGGDSASDQFGYSVSTAGDVNGDGYDDVIVGAPWNDFRGHPSAGAAYIFYGSPSMDSIPDVVMGGETTNSEFGYSVSNAGDVNGDGYSDVIVGADGNDDNGPNSGAAYISYGGSLMDSIYDKKMVGEYGYDYFGKSVSSIGDVNGDGFDDVLVGANHAGSAGSGAVYLFNFFMFKDVTPSGGEVWNVGANETITWKGKDKADLFISTDGGHYWDELATDITPPEDTNYNSYTFLVPHIPTRYALIKITPVWTDPTSAENTAQSDSFFTIRSSVKLIKFEANSGEDNNNVKLEWNTDPGPDVLAGYNLYRIKTNGTKEKVNNGLIKATSYEDNKSSEVTGYELGAVNGLGEEYRIGDVDFYTLKKPLEVVPSVARHNLAIRFIVPDNYIEPSRRVSVNIVSITGRTVKSIFKGKLNNGVHSFALKDIDFPEGSYVCVVNIGGKKAYTSRFQIVR